MDRVARLYQLWSWLPHFRAIAETEHLPTASAALGLSPSALSRALKQLEAAVGRELFVRDGRHIRLNESGTGLLSAIRLAMRGIDDALSQLTDEETPLPLRIAAPGPFFAAIILDVVARISKSHPRARIEMSSCETSEIIPFLCRGHIDVCVHEGPIEHDDLESRHLADIPSVVACARTHPLAGREILSSTDVRDHPFVAPPRLPSGQRADQWPANLPREVAITATHMQMGIDACQTGDYLAVLPRPVVVANDLCELIIADLELPAVVLFATTRERLPSQPPEFTELLADLESAFDSSS